MEMLNGPILCKQLLGKFNATSNNRDSTDSIESLIYGALERTGPGRRSWIRRSNLTVQGSSTRLEISKVQVETV